MFEANDAEFVATLFRSRAHSSVGRALAWHARGRRFEPGWVHRRSVNDRLPITVVPHTHWDREWYLPFEGFRERLVPVMDELLDLLDRGYPHFHLDGQTA